MVGNVAKQYGGGNLVWQKLFYGVIQGLRTVIFETFRHRGHIYQIVRFNDEASGPACLSVIEIYVEELKGEWETKYLSDGLNAGGKIVVAVGQTIPYMQGYTRLLFRKCQQILLFFTISYCHYAQFRHIASVLIGGLSGILRWKER